MELNEVKSIQDLAIDHDYYCSDSNYYSNDARQKFDYWADFYAEFKDADPDMNLVFRWDIHKKEESKRYEMEVFMMLQRKGIFLPIIIGLIDDQDTSSIVSFLQVHYNKLQSLWQPISTL